VANLGFAALAGALMAAALGLASARDDASEPVLPIRPIRLGWPARTAIAAIALIHVVASPLRAWHDTDLLADRGSGTEVVAHDAVELARDRRLFIVAASDPFVFLYPRGVATDTDPGAIRCWSVLSAARTTHHLEPIDAHSFSLTALHRPMLDGFDALFRTRERALAVGDSVEQCGATIRITELTDGLPSSITVTFQRRLGDPTLVFATWRDGHLVPVDPHVAADLPWSPGPGRFL
jgi:hypothetical protein